MKIEEFILLAIIAELIGILEEAIYIFLTR